MSVRVLDEDDVRRIVREERVRPDFVSQRSVESVVGLPRRDYLRLARDGAWPSTRERRLVVSRSADVAAYVETRLRLRERSAANDHDPEALALARVGARRVAP